MQKTRFDGRSVLGISHVALKAADVEASVAFYRDFLGFAEQGRLDYPPGDGDLLLVFIKVSDEQSIEIFNGSKVKPEVDRLCQIAFRVDDAEAVCAHLAQSGYQVPAHVPRGQIKNANFCVSDGCGYVIEFVEHLPEGVTEQQKGQFLPDSRLSDHITHAGLIVRDLNAAQRFYNETLGFKETWRGSWNDQEVSWIHQGLAGGGDFLEWMLSPSADPHFCLEVADVAEVKARLEARPYAADYAAWGRPMEIRIGKNRRRQLNLWDPDGIRVEFMESHTFEGVPAPEPSTAPLPADLR